MFNSHQAHMHNIHLQVHVMDIPLSPPKEDMEAHHHMTAMMTKLAMSTHHIPVPRLIQVMNNQDIQVLTNTHQLIRVVFHPAHKMNRTNMLQVMVKRITPQVTNPQNVQDAVPHLTGP